MVSPAGVRAVQECRPCDVDAGRRRRVSPRGRDVRPPVSVQLPVGPDHDLHIFGTLDASPSGAVQLLFDAHAEELRRYARRIVGSREAAEDVVQDVFLRLWIAQTRLDFGAGMRAYLFRSVRTRSLDLVAHRRCEHVRLANAAAELPSRVEQDAVPQSEPEEGGDSVRSVIEGVIAALPRRQREVARMRVWEHRPTREIAVLLAISPRTVEKHVARVTHALRAGMPGGAPWRDDAAMTLD